MRFQEKYFRLFFLLAVAFGFQGCKSTPVEQSSGNNHPAIVQQGWNESYWNVDAGQQILNIRSGEWASMIEASLYLTVCELLENMNQRVGSRLVAEQNHWVAKCKRIAKANADEYEGGTMWSLEYSTSHGGLAQVRLEQLTKRLAQKKEKPAAVVKEADISNFPARLKWFPSIFFLTTYEQFWADEIASGNDNTRTWRHWAEFQDMKLQVAYAYLHLNLPAAEWQSVAKESESWPDQKAHLQAQPAGSADEKDKRLGRAAAKRFVELEAHFTILKFCYDAGKGVN